MVRCHAFPFVVACLMGAPHLVTSHTWVEQLNRVTANGTLIGPDGFSNGWAGRAEPFSDPLFTNRMPEQGFSMCKPSLAGQQNAEFPNLAAAPGDFVSMRYQENGHVTKPGAPENKPLNRGTIYIYGTTDPKPTDQLFDVHRQWTADGKGGDGRGKLLATRNYDDGQCYQINDAPISKERQAKFAHEAANPMGQDVWCQSAVQLPEDLAQNSDYTLYWVWSWPTLKPEAVAASKDGQFADFPSGFQGDKRAVTSDDVTTAEVYTSCSTIKVQGEKLVGNTKNASVSNKAASGNLAAFSFPEKPNYNNNAIKEQLETQFLVSVDGDSPGNSKPENGTQTTPSSGPTPTQPVGGVVTRWVTVQAEPVTLKSVVTLYVTGQATSAPTQTPGAGEGAAQASISPAPFLKGRHVRGKDSWNFDKRI